MTVWEATVERMERSENRLEREHFFYGTSIWNGYPVLIHKEILKEGGYIRGAPGSGKTAIGLVPLIAQLIRWGDDAVVICDLKGDDAARNQVRDLCRRYGRTFRCFTNMLGVPTHVFNPVRGTNIAELSVNQIAETLLDALSFNYGEDYGASYFSQVPRTWLSQVLVAHPNVQSFDQLWALESFQTTPPINRKDLFHLLAVLESLSHFPQLNMRPGARQHSQEVMDAAIDMDRVIEDKEVIYFFLPASETVTTREIAKLGMYTLFNAHQRRDPAKRKAQTFCFVDECQRVVGPNLLLLLQQARSMGLSFIFANQALADLKTGGFDLRPSMMQLTRFKQIFSESEDEEIQRICRSSGEGIADRDWWVRGYTRKRYISTSRPAVEDPVVNTGGGDTRISYNQVKTVSDDPFASIINVERGSGLTQHAGFSMPISMRGFIISKEAYERYQTTAWPEETPETIVVRRAPLEPKDVEGRRASSFRGAGDMESVDDDAPESRPKRRRGRPRLKPEPEGEQPTLEEPSS